MSSNIKVSKTCLFCGIEYTAKTLHTRYCSHTCNRKHYKQLKRDEKIQKHTNVTGNQNSSTPSQTPFDFTIQQKVFLSIEETAQLLGASRRTIQRLIANGSLKVGKVGSRSIIQRSEIDNFFK